MVKLSTDPYNIQEKICIVVVFYNPIEEQICRFEELSRSLPVVVVDNTSTETRIDGVRYISLGGNKGIAVAQNVGIEYARSKGYNYVLLLDQDSCIDRLFVENIYNDFVRLKETDTRIGFVGPLFIDKQSNQEYKNYTDKNSDYTKTDAIIASGSLISMECLEVVGGMEDNLFIDLVDFEWCWRALSKGFTGYMTRRVKMYHSIGNEYHNWNGFVLGISAPFRYYYIYRNTLWLSKRSYVPTKWKIKSITRGLLDMILVPVFSNQGGKCLKNMLKGIKDGLFKKI